MNINKLKEIVENAPEGATHTSGEGDWYVFDGKYWHNIEWNLEVSLDFDCDYKDMRSLEDIRTIIELYEITQLVYLTRNNGDLDEKIAKTLERFK